MRAAPALHDDPVGPEGGPMGPEALGAVVVAYRPGAGLLANVRAALPHVGGLLVVDNTPGDPSGPVLDVASIPGVAVERLGGNRGVGAALNVGVEHARRRGYAWLLTLDQDTLLDAGWGAAVREGYRAGGGVTAVVGVRFRDPTWEGPAARSEPGAGEVDRVITSGSLWSLGVLGTIGTFREDFLVDGIDNEICFRARARGYRVVQSRQVVMTHTMGTFLSTTWRGRPFQSSGYSATRYYYTFRNFVETARLYGRHERRWLREDLPWLYWLVKSAFANRSYANLAAGVRGVAHGVVRRFGPAPRALQDS